MIRSSVPVLFAASLSLFACRDLEYPEGDEAVNEPPVVSFLLPAPGAVTSLAPIVSLDVRDPNGVASVTLFCGGAPVYVWTAPPYLSSVELADCSGPTDTATGRRTVTLRAVARDVPGLESQPVEQALELDVAVAQLTLSGADRVAPGGRYELRITSDRTLGTIPTARIGSLTAEVIERTDLQTSPLTVFDAVFDPMPGLGTDLYDGGTPPDEVLEEMQRDFLVEVEGRATSGNVARVVTEVTVSRIAWERPLPSFYPLSISPEADGEEPAATDEGLVLAVPSPFVGGWMPALLTHESGAFVPFAGADLITDAGYGAQALDSEGRTFLSRGVTDGGTGIDYAYVSMAGEVLHASSTTHLLAFQPLRRVGDTLCRDDTADAGSCLGSTPSAVHFATCFSPEGETQHVLPDTSEIALDQGAAWAVSGGTYAAWGFGNNCGDQIPIFLADGNGARFGIAGDRMSRFDIDQMIPLGDGRFVAFQFNSNANRDEVFIVNADGSQGGNFFSDAALRHLGHNSSIGLPELYVIGARRTTPPELITRRHLPQSTLLESWPAGADEPTGAVELPGFLETTFDDGSRPGQVIQAADGSVYLQLVQSESMAGARGPAVSAKPFGRDVVLVLDPSFRVRWLYPLPTDSYGWLFANDANSHLYYVDSDNQRVIAFTR